MLFTDEEFDHIKVCVECFRKWKSCFAENQSDKDGC